MDSLGRRFYGVSERTYERDFKQYMNSIPIERLPSSANTNSKALVKTHAPIPVTTTIQDGLETTKNILKTVLTIVFIIGTFRILKRVYDEMEALNQEREEGQETGDALDRIFGSEYQSKFKNSVVNKGGYKTIEEENNLRGVKDSRVVTGEDEIRKLIPLPDGNLMEGLRIINDNTEIPKTEVLNKIMESKFRNELFRIMFKGYTFRELMSANCESPHLLPQAAGYILNCLA